MGRIEDSSEWKALQDKLAMVRDHVRAVAMKLVTGYYLFGRCGTGKSYTVREILERLGVKYHWHQGYCTAKALFEMFMDHFDEVVVLDDVSSLFKDLKAVEILLAALGRQNQKGYRVVSWSKSKEHLQVPFLGGVIAISNLRLAKDPVSAALASRVSTNHYDLSDAEIRLIIQAMAQDGVDGLTAQESQEIAEFVVAAAGAKGVAMDLRLYCDKAVKYYQQHKAGETESHWHDLVRSQLAVKLFVPEDEVQLGPTQAELVCIAKQIRRQTVDSKEQVRLWEKQTGKSRATYYRILKLLDDDENETGLVVVG